MKQDNATRRTIQQIPLDKILPPGLAMREKISPESVRDLADSIEQHGLMSPILLRRNGDMFEIIAGERRYTAHVLLGRPACDAIVVEVDIQGFLYLNIYGKNSGIKYTTLEQAILLNAIKTLFDISNLDLSDLFNCPIECIISILNLLNFDILTLKLFNDFQYDTLDWIFIDRNFNDNNKIEMIDRLRKNHLPTEIIYDLSCTIQFIDLDSYIKSFVDIFNYINPAFVETLKNYYNNFNLFCLFDSTLIKRFDNENIYSIDYTIHFNKKFALNFSDYSKLGFKQ